ncbi:rab-like protein 6 isoform X1 [Hippoglossus hippoglossus]|uniref:rab-like protein 6 isoform X1 n=1 Tax=Hippoglossus hippoglossus TaxID=8267 RepID=UPI00148B61DD|nr:rab-like protein 6 isoform X1 [Hippoglossus hippoglossus]XP_034451645.1 rab-like protein 6 isoform X1 [Hippoglossus hippoglossus]XP_034451646.1 rab-like protein 6 isoform X1 [Hippoglossus hippoglossus]XP_035021793.1 rab-like protein 6 isoform X2 [Hippoglossus stenolepis]
MFSALKKLVGSEPGQLRDKNIPAGLQSMNQSLQRRFAKGVQYNMKIVIRGDRNTGKSTLWHRLQGKKFVEDYIPTQEIQATSIHWNYKTTDDVVKVEVWDVVDKGQKYPLPEGVGKGKKRGDNLKLENEPQESDDVALDAEFLDVYKNCNGVIMMFDITKQWTFNYILRELPKVPTHVPVCVLGNHRDMGEHRVILPDDIRDLIAGLNRPMGSSYIHYAESSMKNGFGLKYLHRFFNIPFLQLQRETLLRQLETNQLDMDATLEELCVQQETEDQNYEIFLENLETRSKSYGSPGPANGSSSGSQSPIVPPSGASTGSSSPSTPQPPIPFQVLPQSPSVSVSSPPPPTAVVSGAASPTAETKPSAQSPEHQQASAASSVLSFQKRSFISRWFGPSPAADAPVPASEDPAAPVCPLKVQSVDDFVPDERLDKSFLEDSLPSKNRVPQPAPARAVDSDSDGEGRGNPMVSGFQDELDLDDTEPSLPQPKTLPPSKDITLTSDEEEGVPAALTITQDQDLDSEPELKAPVIHITKPKVTSKAPEPRGQTTAPISLTLIPATEQPARQGKKKGNTPKAEDSDTDPEAPVAQQMLSFVMDDPDFESEASDTPKIATDAFPIRDELLSDLSDDDMQIAKVPEPLKPTVISFKQKDDTDLFGLGIQEEAPAAKDSSEEQEEKESKYSKEKKKKKKKSKEEDDKTKKKHKHKKKEKEDAATEDDKEKKKKKSRTKKTEVDELEDFLGGGAGLIKRDDGDYEEL